MRMTIQTIASPDAYAASALYVRDLRPNQANALAEAHASRISDL